jgi:hypothetical protein
MKYLAKKPLCYADSFWGAGSIIEVEKNTADYMVGMGILAIADKDAELTPKPDYGPARQSLETVAMEKAAASIVKAVAGAVKPTPTPVLSK